MLPHNDSLREASVKQLELAAAFNHTELFSLNALSVGGSVFHSEGVTFTHAGINNESMVAFPVFSSEEAPKQLDAIVEYYWTHTPKGVGCWSLDPPQPGDLGIMLLARGFQPGWRPCWMALDIKDLQSEKNFLSKLEVLPDNITSIDKIENLPYGDTDGRISSNQPLEGWAWLQRFIGKLDGKVVAQCSVLLTKGALGTAGIYHVAVLPQVRNRGIGKAMVSTACQYAKNMGYRYAVLNATGSGQRIYQQLGFRKTGDGNTWWLMASRLKAPPPRKAEIALAEAIGRGDIPALENLSLDKPVPDLNISLTNGMTLMGLAVHCNQKASAEWLIDHGQQIKMLEAWDIGWKDRAAEILITHPEQANERFGERGMTLLHTAVDRDDIEFANMVLSARPDPYIMDKIYNSNALGWAKYMQKENIARIIEAYMQNKR